MHVKMLIALALQGIFDIRNELVKFGLVVDARKSIGFGEADDATLPMFVECREVGEGCPDDCVAEIGAIAFLKLKRLRVQNQAAKESVPCESGWPGGIPMRRRYVLIEAASILLVSAPQLTELLAKIRVEGGHPAANVRALRTKPIQNKTKPEELWRDWF